MMQKPSFYTKQQVVEKGSHSKFVIEPLAASLGHTLGNALRRTLLSSITGNAIVGVKFTDAAHFFMTLPGVKESVLDIVMNLKQVRFEVSDMTGDLHLHLSAKGKGVVTAAQLKGDVNVVNKDLVLAELTTASATLKVDVIVRSGQGYMSSEEVQDLESGYIAVDSSFSPVSQVNFNVEDARVGRKSNYDRLNIDILTDGSISPEQALRSVAQTLAAQIGHILSGEDVAPDTSASQLPSVKLAKDDKAKVLETIIDELNLPSRVINALLRENIETVADLLARGKDDLVGLKGVGRKSIDLIDDELKKMGVELK